MDITFASGLRDDTASLAGKIAPAASTKAQTSPKQGDVSTISDAARRLAATEKEPASASENTLADFAASPSDMDRTLEDRIAGNEGAASERAGRGSGGGMNAASSRLAGLQKQIAAAQRELQKATAALQQAMAEGGEASVASAEVSADGFADAPAAPTSSAPSPAADGAAVPEGASSAVPGAPASGASPEEAGAADGTNEVAAARMDVMEINNRLRVLNEEMNKAMRAAFGVSEGGGGCIQGTRAEGASSGMKGSIGTSKDPYAAAAAAEAVEFGGGAG